MSRFNSTRHPRAFRVLSAACLFWAAGIVLPEHAPAGTELQAVPEQCGGRNMLAEFESSDPALFKRVMEEAAGIENSEALLWKIEKDGVPPSYLFGTIHIPDTRVTQIPASASEALSHAKTIAVEVANMSADSMMATVSKMPELLAYLDGKTLKSQLSPEEFAKVESIVGKMGMPSEAAAVLRPWLISMLLAVSDCQRAQMQAGRKALDAKLEEQAKSNGAAIVGLETAASQLASMASIPNDQQILMLKAGLAYFDRNDDLIETLVQLYLGRKLGAAMPFQKALAEKVGIPPSAFDGFIKILLVERNKAMVAAAKPMIDKGGVFIAVGALHLSGQTGIIALLREAGYKVSGAD